MCHFAGLYRTAALVLTVSIFSAGSLVISAQDQKKPQPTDTELSAKKKQAFAKLRKELPPKSEYFSYGPSDLDGMLATEFRKAGGSARCVRSDDEILHGRSGGEDEAFARHHGAGALG